MNKEGGRDSPRVKKWELHGAIYLYMLFDTSMFDITKKEVEEKEKCFQMNLQKQLYGLNELICQSIG